MLQQYLISIDARLRFRNSTVSVNAETAECLVARDLLSRDANIKDVHCEKFIYNFQIRVDFCM